jgi:uncharacterized protein (TIRG00374 family)
MKKTLTTALKIAVSVGLFAYIFSKIDIDQLWAILKEAKVGYLLAGVATYFCIQSLSAYRWYLLLKPLGIRVSYSDLFSYYLIGMYFNFFLPTAIGGDVVRVYYLQKHTGSVGIATATVFLDRDIGMAALLLMALGVAAAAGTTLPVPVAGMNELPLAPVFGLIVLAFVVVNLALFYRPTYNLLHRILRILKMKSADDKVERLFSSVNAYRNRWPLLLWAMALSVIVQVGCVAVNVFAASAIGMVTRNGWIDFLVFIPSIGLMSMIPLSLNGMGWREVSYIALFQSVGASEAQSAALAFLWLGVLIAASLPGGIVYVARGAKRTAPFPSAPDQIQPEERDQVLQRSQSAP